MLRRAAQHADALHRLGRFAKQIGLRLDEPVTLRGPPCSHLLRVGFWQMAEHASEGTLRMPRNPIGMSASPPAITRLPPNLGEHSAEILRECDFDNENIAQLITPGGVCAPAM